MIIDGALAASEKLPTPNDLCARFGVSVPTIREAVRILESDGLVDSRYGARIGIRICRPGAETVARPASLLLALQKASVADVLTACVSVEVASVRMIAEKITTDTRTQTEVVALHDILDSNWWPAYESGNFPASLFEFHRALVRMAGSPTLLLLADTLYQLLTPPAVRNWTDMAENPQSTLSYYKGVRRGSSELLTALPTAPPDAAAELWTKHLESRWATLFLYQSRSRLMTAW
ncbi:hypothetical protein A0W34_30585 (plasmid) [Rhodococcus sp. BH4]|nr:hypothetical protein A0W34_30585 [Rhodococcus sp. BH4]